MLATLVNANRGCRGFSYSHKPVAGDTSVATTNRQAVRQSNASGFVVNLSGDNLNEADELSDLATGPVVVVLDAVGGIRHNVVTLAGRKVARSQAVPQCIATRLRPNRAVCVNARTARQSLASLLTGTAKRPLPPLHARNWPINHVSWVRPACVVDSDQ
jgi:hypothetical protein